LPVRVLSIAASAVAAVAVALAAWALIGQRADAHTISSQSRTIAAQGTALNGVLAHTAGDHRDLPPHCVNHPDTSNLCGVGAIGTDCVWAHDNLYRQIVATPGRTAAGR